MHRPTRPARRATLVAAALLAACSTSPAPAPDAGLDAVPAARPAARPAAGATGTTAAPADARFVEHMLAHHAQALEMTALVPARTRRPDLRLLAERIEISQKSEIATMRRWLAERGMPASPAATASHAGSHGASPGTAAAADPHATMPGMLTAAQLAQLAAARGPAFEQRFLGSMIRHHEGALVMVAELFAAPGAGQEPELFGIASDVDADQRAEIARMRALQRAAPPNE